MTDIRILLVEDDKFLRRACETSLRKRGFQVLTAVDGEEAIGQAQTCSPDLILLDMLIPKFSGIEVLQALKADKRTRGIPVVILSNSSIDTDVEKTMELGAIGYLVKASLSLQELGDRVLAYINKADEAAIAPLEASPV